MIYFKWWFWSCPGMSEAGCFFNLLAKLIFYSKQKLLWVSGWLTRLRFPSDSAWCFLAGGLMEVEYSQVSQRLASEWLWAPQQQRTKTLCRHPAGAQLHESANAGTSLRLSSSTLLTCWQIVTAGALCAFLLSFDAGDKGSLLLSVRTSNPEKLLDRIDFFKY